MLWGLLNYRPLEALSPCMQLPGDLVDVDLVSDLVGHGARLVASSGPELWKDPQRTDPPLILYRFSSLEYGATILVIAENPTVVDPP